MNQKTQKSQKKIMILNLINVLIVRQKYIKHQKDVMHVMLKKDIMKKNQLEK